jgi:hypothetical protein
MQKLEKKSGLSRGELFLVLAESNKNQTTEGAYIVPVLVDSDYVDFHKPFYSIFNKLGTDCNLRKVSFLIYVCRREGSGKQDLNLPLIRQMSNFPAFRQSSSF